MLHRKLRSWSQRREGRRTSCSLGMLDECLQSIRIKRLLSERQNLHMVSVDHVPDTASGAPIFLLLP
jgi:hypothetical protein